MLQQPELFIPCRAVCLDARLVHDARGIQRIEQIVKLREAVGEFHRVRGEQRQALLVVAAFQPFFGVFLAVCAWIGNLDAQLARHLVDDVGERLAPRKIFPYVMLGQVSLPADLLDEGVQRGKRSLPERFGTRGHGALLHAEVGPFLQERVVGILRLFVNVEQRKELGEFLFPRIEVGKVGFDLLIGVFVLAHQLRRLVQNVGSGQLFAVLSDAVLHDEQKRFLLHGVVLQKL